MERTAESSILPVEAEKRMVSARLPSVSLPFPSVTRRGSASPNPNPNHSFSPYRRLSTSAAEVFSHHLSSSGISPLRRAASNLCERDPIRVDGSVMFVKECVSDEELRAAVDLRIRTFYEFNNSCGVGDCFGTTLYFNFYGLMTMFCICTDYKRLLTEREYEALKERITGKRLGFRRVACINATLPLSTSLKSAWELCSLCKFSDDGKDRVVVGTLDVNQCLRLADELTGKKPEGIGADHRRAYISNVCVAKELQRKGLGLALITQSKFVALQWAAMQEASNSFRHNFLRHLLLGFHLISRASRRSTSLRERKKAIKLSADAAMAMARGGCSNWSRALMSDRHQFCSPRACRRISKRSSSTCRLSKTKMLMIRKKKMHPPSSVFVARRMVKKKTQMLRRIIPGGESLKGCSLLSEAVDYVVHLQAQVNLMHQIARAMGKSSNDHM
ncbi:hypothetical protein AXF42_Ash004542 [Apostasia shenzhenica]|uniref:IBH1-like N-terminal domain-containing protein n=1 Tax=Apostasia shenzhenica TaxID=1088818 RepID=A0A2I0BGY4_9ASPA|nr:hypothetical protein AXF42_Ash004542 [Apostasia shenzhenica]